MDKFLLDSNVIIDYLRYEKNVSANLDRMVESGVFLSICPQVYYEVVRGFKADFATRKLASFFKLFDLLSVLPFDMSATEKAIEIYVQLHNGKLIEDNDIYIAAVAMVNDCTLVTANTKHFGRIENLKIVNWRE